MKNIGFYFSELLVTTGGYVGLLWYFTLNGYVFSSYNREISWLIVTLFGIGVLMVASHLLHLYREDQQISVVYAQLQSYHEAMNRLFKNRHALSPHLRANALRKTTDEHFAVLAPSLTKTRIYRLVKTAATGDIPNHETLAGLLQQQEDVRGNRVRYIAGILIMLGLLGTFLGLVQAIKYLQHFFTAAESIDIAMLFSDMKHTLGGLDKAFGTSIGGITAYLVLGYLHVALRTKQAYLLNRIETLTLEEFLPLLRGMSPTQSQDVSNNAIEILQTIPERLSAQLGEMLEQIIQQTIGGSSENLKATGEYLQQAAEGIHAGQETFTQTLSSFGNFLSSFQEGREQLMESQQTIASGIREFSRALVKLEENQGMLASSLELTGNYMKNSETRLGDMDQIIQQMHSIWTDNRRIFEQIAQRIEEEHGTLSQTTGHLHASLTDMKAGVQEYFQTAQQDLLRRTNENSTVSRHLLESHTLLTTLVHDLKNFILDEQNGLRLLSTSMNETFGEARFQYHQLGGHLEAVFKRVHESQEQLSQLQDSVTSIEQQLQARH